MGALAQWRSSSTTRTGPGCAAWARPVHGAEEAPLLGVWVTELGWGQVRDPFDEGVGEPGQLAPVGADVGPARISGIGVADPVADRLSPRLVGRPSASWQRPNSTVALVVAFWASGGDRGLPPGFPTDGASRLAPARSGPCRRQAGELVVPPDEAHPSGGARSSGTSASPDSHTRPVRWAG